MDTESKAPEKEEGIIKIIAYQIAEQLNLKKLKADYKAELYSSSSVELFYFQEAKVTSAIYVLGSGAVVFANYEEIEISNFLKFLLEYCVNCLGEQYTEDLIVHKGPELSFSYNDIFLPQITPDAIRIVMLNVAQSASLDFYTESSESLLEDTSQFTNQLEKYGQLKISRRNLLKFIGKTLNIKNRIIDNLYIFDVPDIVWENEYLDKVNDGMSKTFDINMRFRETEYTLKIVESNLSIFTDLVQQKTSNIQELIIIFLILFEVVNVIINYIIKS
jgi:uncharacterized Rmd1/YagE family protein